MASDVKRREGEEGHFGNVLDSLTSAMESSRQPDVMESGRRPDYSTRRAGETRGGMRANKPHKSVTISWQAEEQGTDKNEGQLRIEPPSMILVGRLKNADICLGDEMVSRIHAKIYVMDDYVEIEDAGSSNGTRLGGKRIERENWESGETVKIGHTLFKLETSEDNANEGKSQPAVPNSVTDAETIELQITATRGNILDCSSEVLALGLHDELFVSSTARLLDQKCKKLISTLRKSGHLDLRSGATTLVPVSQDDMNSDYMLFVGLGDLRPVLAGRLPNNLELHLTSRLRSLGFHMFEYMLQFGLGSMASVVSLAKKSDDSAQLVREFIRGCLLAILQTKDRPNAHDIPTINLCEIDEQRYAQILYGLNREASRLREQSYRAEILGRSAQERKIVLSIIPETKSLDTSSSVVMVPPENREPVKLDIRALGVRPSDGALEFELSCHRPSGFAYAETQHSYTSGTVLQTQIEQIYERSLPHDQRAAMAASLFDQIMPSQIWQAIEEETQKRPLCLAIDADVAMIPWEALKLGHCPSTRHGTSRILRGAAPSGIRPMTNELQLPINLLLVINPTGDLPEAEQEGARLLEFASRMPEQFNITIVERDEASKSQLIRALLSIHPQIMHFCGHSAFSREAPKQSGLICAGGEVLTGIDMASISPMPSILILNACLSGRLRQTVGSCSFSAEDASSRPVTGVAEAAIYGGVNSLVGTLWQVGDQEAGTFAEAFYGALLEHKLLGEAVAYGRDAVRLTHPNSFDWANYVLYGDESLQLRP